jgi:hypothetical protein
MANMLYDFFPGVTVTPYIGGGAGVVDANIQGCKMCLTMFAYQGILDLGFNATPAMRIGLEGRYYGTTNQGAYFHNNIMAMLSLSYKFGQPEMAPPPPPSAPTVAPPSFMVFLRLGPLEPEPAGAEHDQAGGRCLQAEGQCANHGNGPHRHFRPESYNMALSLRRANAVKDALVREGVPAQAISVVGRGEQGLLVQTGDGVREPQNRRVEIVVQ